MAMELTALVLEDSQTQAQIIGKMLESMGWGHVHCETVREATEALTMMKADALLFDVFVGQHNTLLHVPRFRKIAPDCPLILMTAGSNWSEIENTLAQARKTGAQFVLKKPFTTGVLRNVFAEIERDRLGGVCRKHVLIIDDSRTVRKFTVNAFKSAHYRVSEAQSMETAFADVDIAHVDLVVCDIFMPGMGGVEGMTRLKAIWPKVKIIAMSGGIDGKMTEQQALAAAKRVGADAQLAKPFSSSQIVNLSNSLLEAID